MKAKIEKHIPAAIAQLQAYYESHGSHPLKKEYKSYLSSLGASIIMSGLLPTLAVYYADDSRADRKEVIKWVYNMIRPLHNNCDNHADLLGFAIHIRNDHNRSDTLTEDIKNISIALKLSIRTFPISK